MELLRTPKRVLTLATLWALAATGVMERAHQVRASIISLTQKVIDVWPQLLKCPVHHACALPLQ